MPLNVAQTDTIEPCPWGIIGTTATRAVTNVESTMTRRLEKHL